MWHLNILLVINYNEIFLLSTMKWFPWYFDCDRIQSFFIIARMMRGFFFHKIEPCFLKSRLFISVRLKICPFTMVSIFILFILLLLLLLFCFLFVSRIFRSFCGYRLIDSNLNLIWAIAIVRSSYNTSQRWIIRACRVKPLANFNRQITAVSKMPSTLFGLSVGGF